MTKHIEAMNHLAATGDYAAAWAIAQQDEGLLPGVTFEAWQTFARQLVDAPPPAKPAAPTPAPSSGDIDLAPGLRFRWSIQGERTPEIYGWLEQDHSIIQGTGGFWRTANPTEALARCKAAFPDRFPTAPTNRELAMRVNVGLELALERLELNDCEGEEAPAMEAIQQAQEAFVQLAAQVAFA